VCLGVVQVDPAPYLDTCLYLYCSLPPADRASAVCDTLAGYARECAQQHVGLVWRTAGLCGKDTPGRGTSGSGRAAAAL